MKNKENNDRNKNINIRNKVIINILFYLNCFYLLTTIIHTVPAEHVAEHQKPEILWSDSDPSALGPEQGEHKGLSEFCQKFEFCTSSGGF